MRKHLWPIVAPSKASSQYTAVGIWGNYTSCIGRIFHQAKLNAQASVKHIVSADPEGLHCGIPEVPST